jgi:hypothetical protein
MLKSISVVVLTENGKINAEAMREDFEKQLANLDAQISTDFDTVAAEINAFLLANPGLKTIASSALVRSLWETRVENGDTKGKTHDEKAAMFARLEEVVPEYVRATTDRFHMGRKTGIAIRYVEGESAKDKDGNVLYNGDGDEVQAYRHSDEEWAKMTAPKATPAVANGATATAPAAS